MVEEIHKGHSIGLLDAHLHALNVYRLYVHEVG